MNLPYNNKRNILIVGGAGYIGGAVTDLLKKQDFYNIIVYDLLIYENCYFKDLPFVYGDIRDHNKLRKYIEWADTIIWLAAIVGDGACSLNPELSRNINFKSLKWLCDTLKDYDDESKKVIFMSTCSVYGAQDGILHENSTIKPLSVYGVTKYNAEQYLHQHWRNNLIFRLGTVFGVGDCFSRIRLDLVVNILTMKAAIENKLTVFGGDQFRPLIHVKDVARAIVDNIKNKDTGIFNICSQNVRIIDLAYQVRNHFPDCELEITKMEFEDSRNYRVSSNKASEILLFNNKYSIDDGILQIKKIIDEKRVVDLSDKRYSNHSFLQTKIDSVNSITE